MSDTVLKTRIIQKHDFEANWEKAKTFIPKKGEIIIYDPEIELAADGTEVIPDAAYVEYKGNKVLPSARELPYTFARFKIGDGIHTVKQLPFTAVVNLRDGLGENSIQLRNSGSIAGGKNAVAFGKGTYAGAYGYHYSHIDFENHKIRITSSEDSVKPSTDWTSVVDEPDFINPFNVGDKISLSNNEVYLDALTVSNVEGNVLTFEESFPFEGLAGNTYFDNYVAFRTQNPVGIICVGHSSFTTGVGAKAYSYGAAALGNNTLAEGWYTLAEGNSTKALGQASRAAGYGSISVGHYSNAQGLSTKAIGQGANAMGEETEARGKASNAQGFKTTAQGLYSNAMGEGTTASGRSANAQGVGSTASGAYSDAAGRYTEASGEAAATFGRETKAQGNYSEAHGLVTVATHDAASANGRYTRTSRQGQFVVGQYNTDNADALFIVGTGSDNSHRNNGLTIDVNGNATVSGKITAGKGPENDLDLTTKKYSDDKYYHKPTDGSEVVTETSAWGGSLALKGAKVNQNYSIGFGTGIEVNGQGAAAFGIRNIINANGKGGFVAGIENIVDSTYQAALGKWNQPLSDGSLLVIGNGTSATNRSNAFVVHSDGRATVAKDPTESMDVTTKQYVDTSDLNISNELKGYVDTAREELEETIGNTETELTKAINDVQNSLNTLSLTDSSVKLDSELKTYYNVGKITNASGTNPVTIGNAGDSLRDVFNKLFNMDEIQPTITQNPSVSCSFSSTASDERGTEISSISYSISFNDGKYTNADTTGVKMTNYSFLDGTASSSTSTSGTITLPSTYVVGTSSTFSTTLTANHDEGDVAKTNLGNNSNPEIKIASGSVTNEVKFSKTAVDYPYYVSSNAETVNALSDIAKAKKTTNLITTTGETCNYNANAYVWIFVRKGSTTSQATKTIQAYSDIAKEWGTFLGGTQKMGEITFNKQNGASDTFYAYRTLNVAQAADSAKFRLQ